MPPRRCPVKPALEGPVGVAVWPARAGRARRQVAQRPGVVSGDVTASLPRRRWTSSIQARSSHVSSSSNVHENPLRGLRLARAVEPSRRQRCHRGRVQPTAHAAGRGARGAQPGHHARLERLEELLGVLPLVAKAQALRGVDVPVPVELARRSLHLEHVSRRQLLDGGEERRPVVGTSRREIRRHAGMVEHAVDGRVLEDRPLLGGSNEPTVGEVVEERAVAELVPRAAIIRRLTGSATTSEKDPRNRSTQREPQRSNARSTIADRTGGGLRGVGVEGAQEVLPVVEAAVEDQSEAAARTGDRLPFTHLFGGGPEVLVAEGEGASTHRS